MRKALIGLILAATAMVPAAAQAQHWRDRGQNQDAGEDRSSQVEQRHHERQAQQQAPQQVQQQAPQVQVVDRQRGGDGNRGNWQGRGGDNNSNNRGNWQGRGGDGNNGNNSNWQGRSDNNNRGNWQGRSDNGNRGDGNRGNWQGRSGGNQGSIYPQAWQGDPNDPRLQRYRETERRNQQRYGNDGRDWRGDNRGDNRNWRGDNRGDNRNWRDDNRGRRSWNRDWRGDNRYDWQRYRYSNRNLFHVGPYYSPYRGYGYNRFSIGIFLDPFFYDQRYWIGDPWQYRLPPAEPGTEWVRYYNDVLLVDVDSGEVLDVIYDFFW